MIEMGKAKSGTHSPLRVGNQFCGLEVLLGHRLYDGFHDHILAPNVGAHGVAFEPDGRLGLPPRGPQVHPLDLWVPDCHPDVLVQPAKRTYYSIDIRDD